jgi:hypothetical protein
MPVLRSGTGGRTAQEQAVTRRLRPLRAGVILQNCLLWVPVEKMFMTQIGIDAAEIGIVAAAYAAVVPLLEVPSGIVADRWSRSGMMAVATVALAASSLVGGLSTGLGTYALAAALLGVYFALSSGIADSIVYDTLAEETGSSAGYERQMGRLQVAEGAALVLSALGGGLLAALTSARVTYLATVPVVAAAVLAFRRCREPRLHRAAERVSIRRQTGMTLRAMGGSPVVRRLVVLTAVTALLAQVVFEFGPLWLVSLHAPAALYGPYWALLVSTVGVGGFLASRTSFGRARTVWLIAIALVAATLALTVSRSLPVVIAAQAGVALVAAMAGVRAGFLLHEAVTATVRAGVSSGAGTLSWILFLPVSLLFGWLSRVHGVHTAGWLLVLIAAGLATLLVRTPTAAATPQTAPPAPPALAAA